MPKVPVYNQTGEKVADIELNAKVFGVEPKVELLEEAVRMQLAGRRKGLAHAKTRAEVRGGGRKPWAQKGTGRARHGSIRSPLWPGGGVTFGPRSNRNWRLKMNKSAYRKALAMALTDKVMGKALVVVDRLELSEPKTAALAKVLKNLQNAAGLQPRRALLVLTKGNQNVEIAGRNMAEAQLAKANSLNVYDLLNATNVIVLKDALQAIESAFTKKE